MSRIGAAPERISSLLGLALMRAAREGICSGFPVAAHLRPSRLCGNFGLRVDTTIPGMPPQLFHRPRSVFERRAQDLFDQMAAHHSVNITPARNGRPVASFTLHDIPSAHELLRQLLLVEHTQGLEIPS